MDRCALSFELSDEPPQGFLLVFSLVDRDSFNQVPSLQKHILQTKEKPFIPLVLVGNKSDRDDRAVPESEARELAKSFGSPYLETSAKDRVNVDEVRRLLRGPPTGQIFFEIVREVRRLGPSSTANSKDKKPKPKQPGRCALI